MPDPLKGDYLMDPDLTRRRGDGPVASAFKTTLGVLLAVVVVAVLLLAVAALFLLPASG